MKKRYLLYLVLGFIWGLWFWWSFLEDTGRIERAGNSTEFKFLTPEVIISNLEIPGTTAEDSIIRHSGFSLVFNSSHMQSEWVAYVLTKDQTKVSYERTNRFEIDPKIYSGTATHADFTGSGYDRGHIAPASDMAWSLMSMHESFYYSNISPQLPGFNRGVWKRLEYLLRSWAINYGVIYVVKGPVLTPDLNSIGFNQVSVPEYFYKAILYYDGEVGNGIGFILPHESSKEDLQSFAVTIDSVQIKTGIDFFPLLPGTIQQNIETTLCIPCWDWEITFPERAVNIQQQKAQQCSGITLSDRRCRNTTLNLSGYCHLHKSKQEY